MSWIPLVNRAADRAGGIHDDETARQKGFPAGLVPGDVHVALLTAAAVDRVGPAWYEQGWLRMTFVAPAYAGEEARVAVDGDDAHLTLTLLRRDDSVICAGHAGIGGPPPWERDDLIDPPSSPDDGGDPLPHEPIGTRYEDAVETITRADVDRSIDGFDPSPWYRTSSPWGDPIVPTVAIFNLIHRTRATPMPPEIARAMRAGMNARFDAVHHGPMRFDMSYRRRAHLVEKGIRGRYASRTVELTYEDPETGAVGFRSRWRIKWVR
jgi:hypothetical protein